MFPEKRFPCNTQKYRESLALGKIIASELSVTFVFLARDCENAMAKTLERVERTGELFLNWQAVAVENDSKDHTASILGGWQKTHKDKVRVDSSTQKKPKWRSIRSKDRTADMSVYRDRCVSLTKELPQTDVVIVLDSDLQSWSLEGLLNTFSWWGQWDVMASNGLRWQLKRWMQVDAWSYRTDSWKSMSFGVVRERVPKRGSDLVPLFCAFGGLACYRSEAYCGGSYTENYQEDDVEHATFHRNLRSAGFDRLFLNPSQIVIYGPWQ